MPLIDKEVPIICDDYVDKEFGTGVLKITPAHDPNDYLLGQKHKLEFVSVIDDDGRINENGKFFIGEDRSVVRKKL